MSHWSQKFIITGCPGSGKTTLIKHLRDNDILCVDEPARQVIAEQRAIQGDGLSDRNVLLFTELLLTKSLDSYKKYEGSSDPIIFDRGTPDVICGLRGTKPRKLYSSKTFDEKCSEAGSNSRSHHRNCSGFGV